MAPSQRFTDLSQLKSLIPDTRHSQAGDVSSPRKYTHDGKGVKLHITLDRSGRKGKTVTLISGFHHNPTTMEDLARILKQHCGSGGTVKGLVIEIQGEQRKRVAKLLTDMNYIIT